MKKTLLLMVAMLLILSGAASAKIVGSAHDLSTAGSSVDASDVLSACQFCHTPHHANTDIEGAPLWNRFHPDTAGYTLYDSGQGGTGAEATLSGTSVGAPGVHSTTCMSCHDGTMAFGDVILGAGTDGSFATTSAGLTGTYSDAMDGTAYPNSFLGTSLADTHPVGIVYDDTAATLAGLSATSAQVGTTGSTYTVGALAIYKIYGGDRGTGTVECGSCHNPHGDDYANAGTTTGEGAPFLRGAKNEMCTDCHSEK